MLPEANVCERARRARDPRFDGRFFVGVKTTGIYCRPVCPAPTAKRANVTFYPTAAAAEAAGLRPCLRCRPETAPGSAAWIGTASTVRRALVLIDDGALDDEDVATLAARLGVGDRHLRRLFVEHLGAAPIEVAKTRRVQRAKRLLDATDLPMTEVAHAAGFGSVRRFNTAMRTTYDRTPTALRALRTRERNDGGSEVVAQAEPHGYRLRLAYERPYDHAGLLAFFGPRAIRGVECVDGGADAGGPVYRRTFRIDGATGALAVHAPPPADRRTDPALDLRVVVDRPQVLTAVRARVRRVFDLDARPRAIATALRRDARLAPLLKRWPGCRVPGAFDAFEALMRAVLGQQVTVVGATTLAGRLVERFGTPVSDPSVATLTALFPSAATLAAASVDDVASLGMPGKRAETLIAIARAVVDGSLPLAVDVPTDVLLERLAALPGVGPWTVAYAALRVARDPDAFPAGDLGVRKALGNGAPLPASDCAALAEDWRPWRAYATLLLWRSLADDD